MIKNVKRIIIGNINLMVFETNIIFWQLTEFDHEALEVLIS